MPRYPAQMYEAFGYLILFILRKIYDSHYKDQGGFLLGIFFLPDSLVSASWWNMLRKVKGGFEEILSAFSTGQWLSIPFIILGLIILGLSFRKKTA